MARKSHLSTIVVVLMLVFTALAYVRWGYAGAACARGCNVILVMADTVSARHLDAYGYARETMPRTSAFFAEGAIFENAYAAAPWTFPSFISMYFSDLASTVRYDDLVGNSARPHMQSALRDGGVTVRAALLPNTIFIFDAVHAPFRPEEKLPTDWQVEEKGRKKFNTVQVFDAGLSAVKTLHASSTVDRFFVIVHTFQAHDPYESEEPYKTMFGTSTEDVSMSELLKINTADAEAKRLRMDEYALRYDQGLVELDDVLGGFLEALPEAVLRDTVVIFASDHGEAFGEHGQFWHGGSLYAEEVHVPLMIRVPGGRSTRVREPVSLLDIAPTVLALSDVGIPSSFVGKDLTSALFGDTLVPRTIPFEHGFPPFFGVEEIESNAQPPVSLREAHAQELEGPLILQQHRGVRLGDYKLLSQWGKNLFFDLAEDPNELKNLYGAPHSPERAGALQELEAALADIAS